MAAPPYPYAMGSDFLHDIGANAANRAILSRWSRIGLPNAWLVAGCLFQTIWNLKSGRESDQDIKDYDLFYFDGDDLSESGEAAAQAHVDGLLGDLGIVVEVANQARVHLWYPQFFGQPYSPLANVDDGIRRFLALETCVGVRPGAINAPHGLNGLYAGTLSPNPLVPYAGLFEQKAASYQQRWPWLVIQGAPPGNGVAK